MTETVLCKGCKMDFMTSPEEYTGDGYCVPCHVHSIGDMSRGECGCFDCEAEAEELPEWSPSGYNGLAYFGKEGAAGYRGYVVRVTDENPVEWFAYAWDVTTETHRWAGQHDTEEGARAVLEAI
ncbi:hypothetical protein [Streptomyces sp. H39-S7]|uniref:hypothetical protein n=1 Tax=Streptomyces sp. H39-S7 TaxID=3004357 RepID=UPI0022AF289B|nr:hypothetical protein [Streptomyces sp. H39-S7]MCZ4119057.1 hypothetical protein [Streptomyces sp. H39-S7]